jgi:leucyl aminopeptidase
MEIAATTAGPLETDADTIVIGLFDGEGIAHDVEGAALGALVDSGEAKTGLKKVAVAHAGGRRFVLAGLGKREDFGPEQARLAAAAAQARAAELGARRLCWEVPHHVDDAIVGALVEGTALAAYRFERFKSQPDENGGIAALLMSAHHDVSAPVDATAIVMAATSVARDLQNTPSNVKTPTWLAEQAVARAAEVEGLSAEFEGRDGLEARGMGAFLAVARGSAQEPALITLRYEHPDAAGPLLGFVGKAVTFDTGGISIKPAATMHEMKFDMSGGAAVIGAMEAIARLRLPVRIVAVVGATENMPGGNATRPGDIVTAKSGTTVEINNTDAEGRLVLADCIAHALELGAERLVDMATLTGGIVVSLGSTYAGLMSNDEEWAAVVNDAATASGDLVWRLPLHPEYDDLIKGAYGDITNLSKEPRKATSITAAHFLSRFAGDTPWAHVDIAGTAYGVGRSYTGKAGSGFGVRLLVEVARRVAA